MSEEDWRIKALEQQRDEARAEINRLKRRCTPDCRLCLLGEGEHNFKRSYTEEVEAERDAARDEIAEYKSESWCFNEQHGRQAEQIVALERERDEAIQHREQDMEHLARVNGLCQDARVERDAALKRLADLKAKVEHAEHSLTCDTRRCPLCRIFMFSAKTPACINGACPGYGNAQFDQLPCNCWIAEALAI